SNSRFSFKGQLSISLRCNRFLGFLAALAHFALHLPARLPLYSARRQSGPAVPRRAQSCYCHVPGRTLARRGLDVRRLGSLAWLIFSDRARLSHLFRRQTVGE